VIYIPYQNKGIYKKSGIIFKPNKRIEDQKDKQNGQASKLVIKFLFSVSKKSGKSIIFRFLFQRLTTDKLSAVTKERMSGIRLVSFQTYIANEKKITRHTLKSKKLIYLVI